MDDDDGGGGGGGGTLCVCLYVVLRFYKIHKINI